MDSKSLRILEFPKVLAKLAEYTSFSAGRKLAENLTPTTDEFEAVRWQAETREALALLETNSEISIGGARDVRAPVDRAERGMTLLPEVLIDVRNTLVASRTLKRKIEKIDVRYPHLAEIAELIEDCPGIISSISQTLDERGEVLDSASTKLANIRRELRVSYGRIQEKLRSMISSQSAYLQEPLISMRNGRYVVPVRAESRGNIKGIVHDQSGSGATVWVEPIHTVELNNDFRRLQLEEEKEIQRILAELSAKVADQGERIVRIVERMAEFDLIFAKARYASATNSIEPEFIPWRPMQTETMHPGSKLWFKGARHPLLSPDEVIPTNLIVPDDIFLILITGPNTGGKTVSLKTAGLMTIMAQAGMHVPCTEARLSMYDNIFADIGDEQSIEQSLSTFSAHMTNMIRILEAVDERSLVLLDELGSGTDPAEGAALAQAIIEYLRDKGATTFTATHYPELKAYATQTPGVTNASLLFDVDTLSPTYEMTIGLPGKSNALAIARRLGLSEAILDSAMSRLGVGSKETEQLLDAIYDMRDKIATEEAAARLATRRAERDRGKLKDRLTEIEIEREQVLKEARAQVEEELEAIRKEIKNVRRQLRGAESKGVLKRLNKEVGDIEQRPLSAVTNTPLIDSIIKQENKPQPRKLKVGDEVMIKTIKTRGQVIALHKTEAEVAIGRLHMRVALDELDFKGRPVQIEEEPIRTPQAKSPGLELDIRGKRVEAGLSELDKYIDSAVRARMPWVRIIHGKGTGRLRTAVRQALNKNKAVLSWEEGRDGEGGAGVTVAKFEETPAE